jgi:hypothetical protein
MPDTTTTTTAATTDAGATTGTTQPTETQSATPESFDAWLEAQEEGVKGLISKRFEALENTARVRKEEREALADQLKDLKKLKGEELQAAIDDMSVKLDSAEKRAAFLEQAIDPAVQCKNPRAAWLLADAGNLFDRKGLPDWAAIKREAPELFGTPVANANAGRATQTPPNPHQNMNTFIRRASGRG